MFPPRPISPQEPAHLRDARGFSPPVHRYAVPPALAGLVRRFWVPVWSLPDGEVTVQRVLQYPVCQVVVGHEYAHLVGPHSGLSTQELHGSGWVVGAMMQPAAGALLAGGRMTHLHNRTLPLSDAAVIDAPTLVPAVRAAMAPDPNAPGNQLAAATLLGDALAVLLPVDAEGELVNTIVDYVESEPTVQRVTQVCEKFALTERTLQRLTSRRIGLTPKWLIQRRRLHEAAARMHSGDAVDLATLATDLGYADQAHFTRDWRTVTGLTPAAFAAEPHPPPE